MTDPAMTPLERAQSRERALDTALEQLIEHILDSESSMDANVWAQGIAVAGATLRGVREARDHDEAPPYVSDPGCSCALGRLTPTHDPDCALVRRALARLS